MLASPVATFATEQQTYQRRAAVVALVLSSAGRQEVATIGALLHNEWNSTT